MTDDEYAQKCSEMDRLPNDPAVPVQAELVWRLLDEISLHDRAMSQISRRQGPFGGWGSLPAMP